MGFKGAAADSFCDDPIGFRSELATGRCDLASEKKFSVDEHRDALPESPTNLVEIDDPPTPSLHSIQQYQDRGGKMVTTKCVAFWVYSDNAEILLDVPLVKTTDRPDGMSDIYSLVAREATTSTGDGSAVADGNRPAAASVRLEVRTNFGQTAVGGTQPETRTFTRGIHGIACEKPVRFRVQKGDVDFHIKEGKDPWPLPPPPPPNGFPDDNNAWRNDYTDVFLSVGEDGLIRLSGPKKAAP